MTLYRDNPAHWPGGAVGWGWGQSGGRISVARTLPPWPRSGSGADASPAPDAGREKACC